MYQSAEGSCVLGAPLLLKKALFWIITSQKNNKKWKRFSEEKNKINMAFAKWDHKLFLLAVHSRWEGHAVYFLSIALRQVNSWEKFHFKIVTFFKTSASLSMSFYFHWSVRIKEVTGQIEFYSYIQIPDSYFQKYLNSHVKSCCQCQGVISFHRFWLTFIK